MILSFTDMVVYSVLTVFIIVIDQFWASVASHSARSGDCGTEAEAVDAVLLSDSSSEFGVVGDCRCAASLSFWAALPSSTAFEEDGSCPRTHLQPRRTQLRHGWPSSHAM